MTVSHPIRPAIYTVPFGQDFCDAAVAAVMDWVGSDIFALGDAVLLLPNNRAIKAITEAFIRKSAHGLLLPRMAAIGDLNLDEALGPIIDPLDVPDEEPIYPAIDPLERLITLADLIGKQKHSKAIAISATESIRMARLLAATIDELNVEKITIRDFPTLHDDHDLAIHWQNAYGDLLSIWPKYLEVLKQKKLQDASNRRNQLLGRFANKISGGQIASRLFAVGISTSAPAITEVLRAIALQQNNAVILPSIDLSMPDGDWDKLLPDTAEDDSQAPSVRHETHPQFHLKLLLDRMGFQRSEISLLSASSKNMHHSISDIFCVPEQSAAWMQLPKMRKKMPNLRQMIAEDSAEEAIAIAILVRKALEVDGQRIAIVTPDRELALRVSTQLKRWGIDANDSAGSALLKTANGTLLKAVIFAIAQGFAPNRLLAILQHPLVHTGEERLAWLKKVRQLDLVLRGPILGHGLAAIGMHIDIAIADERRKNPEKLIALKIWWSEVATQLTPLEQAAENGLASLLPLVINILSALTNDQIWIGANGRQLTGVLESICNTNISALSNQPSSSLPSLLDALFEGQVTRPAYGGHPRVAIYGLLEARLQQADTIICAGLNEGSWPQLAQPDPWLAPHLRRQLNLSGMDRNIGLAAHDLATFIGANEVIISRAKRDRDGPTVTSRFLLRLQAYLGEALNEEAVALDFARRIDEGQPALLAERPAPMPSLEQRDIKLSVTDFDKLKSDPYAIYARKILSLEPLDAIDAEPSSAWRGTVIHDILEQWSKQDNCDPHKLVPRAEAYLSNPAFHPLLSTLWQPRIIKALQWVADETDKLRQEYGRKPALTEAKANMKLAGVLISGRVDRIDRIADNEFAIIDYKSGSPPRKKQILNGFALQLGLMGLMLRDGHFKNANGNVISGDAKSFEYWTMQKRSGTSQFGNVIKATVDKPKDHNLLTNDFVEFALAQAVMAIDRWITGNEAFTARLHPEYPNYQDFDHLMRLAEWDGRQPVEGEKLE